MKHVESMCFYAKDMEILEFHNDYSNFEWLSYEQINV